MARRYGQDDSDAPAPRNDVYTGLLAVSFFAMLAGCLLLLLDWMSYPEGPPKSHSAAPLPGVKAPPARKAPPVDEPEPKKAVEPKEEKKEDKEEKKEEAK